MSIGRVLVLIKDDGHFIGGELEHFGHGVGDDDGLVSQFENGCHHKETQESFPHF
jgi:hypothetical protein